MEPSQFAHIGVTFIEERAGQAVVRLPNGSKTTLDFNALRPTAGLVHLTFESAYCKEQGCNWSVEGAPSRVEVEDAYLRHPCRTARLSA